MPSRSGLDAVTIDAFGTLLELEDPTAPLRSALSARGVERSRHEVQRAFEAEAAYYKPRSWLGRNAESLAELRRNCVAVFLEELGVDSDPADFVPAYIAALCFRPITGVQQALRQLREAGLALCCVGNWDCTLPDHLADAGLARWLDAIVTSAEAEAAKPDPAIFELALERLGVEPARALHIGDEEADRAGALAAGMAFEPAPLVTLPRRLGL